MNPTVTYAGRSVHIEARTEWSLQEDEPTIVGEELEDRWEPDDYDIEPTDSEDES